MHKASALITLCLALAACGSSGEEQATPAASPTSAQPGTPTPAAITNPAITDLTELAGEYRVAAIDSEPFDESYGIGVTITGDRLSYEPVCAGFVWRIAFDGGLMSTERVVRAEEAPGQGPPPPCAIGLRPAEIALGQAIDAAAGAMRTPANGILLSGGGRSVLLFSQ